MSIEDDALARAQAIDRKIGDWLRERRVAQGVSQTELARHLGISYQQLHKYENGANRISAGKLWLVAECLDVPVFYLFQPPLWETHVKPGDERQRWYDLYDKLPKGTRRDLLELVERL